jgi:hypothetical protein
MCGLVRRVLHVNIRMSLVIGSVPTPLTWHGVWLRLIEATTTARGALASALATRMTRVGRPQSLLVGMSGLEQLPPSGAHA